MKPTKSDGILVVVLLGVTGLFLLLFCFLRPADDTPLVAIVTIDGAEYVRLPLDTDTTVTLPTGHAVTVRDGEVSVTSAPCPDRICLKTPPARSSGGSIICLPEKVVITIAQEAAS